MGKIPKEIKWLDKHKVGDEGDIPNLEANAAIYEFQHKLPRKEAEAKAYQEYLQDKATDSAAHHYLGMRAALAGKNDQAAQAHGESYAKAMKHLGMSPTDMPSKEIMSKVENLKQKVYSYKAHPADDLIS